MLEFNKHGEFEESKVVKRLLEITDFIQKTLLHHNVLNDLVSFALTTK